MPINKTNRCQSHCWWNKSRNYDLMSHYMNIKESSTEGFFSSSVDSFFFLFLLPHRFHNKFCCTSWFSQTVNCLASVFGIVIPTNFRNSQRAVAIFIIINLEVSGFLDRLLIFVPNHFWVRVTWKIPDIKVKIFYL